MSSSRPATSIATAATITGRRRPHGVVRRSDHAPTIGGTATAMTAPRASAAPVAAMAASPGTSSWARAGTRIPSSGSTWKFWPNQYSARATWRPSPKRAAGAGWMARSLMARYGGPAGSRSGADRLHLAALPRPDRVLLALDLLVPLHRPPHLGPGAAVDVGHVGRAGAARPQPLDHRVDRERPQLPRVAARAGRQAAGIGELERRV